MRSTEGSKMRYIISLALLFTLLLPFSPVYGDSSIEYDDNGLTPTEQQEGNSGGFGWNPLGWDWSGVGDFFGDLWDGFVDGLSSAWEGTVDFFSNLGDMMADLWNALPDWAQDLIITVGLILGVAIAAVLLVVAGVISVAVAVVAVVAAAIAGIIYYALYGGTDAFNWMHAAGWIFGSALVAGLATFAVTSIGLGTIWAGIKSFGAMLGSWIARGLSGIWSGLRWLGGKAWGGLRWLGGAIWTGIRAAGRGIAWLAGKAWGGLKWLGSKMWGVLKPAGSWVWTFIKANATAGLVSALASMAIDGFKYFVLGESMTLGNFVTNTLLSALFGFVGGPIAGNIKVAFQARSWGQLVGWAGLTGLLAGANNLLGDLFKGEASWHSFVSGTLAGLFGAPFASSLSDVGGGFLANLGVDFGTKAIEEFVKAGYNNAGEIFSFFADTAVAYYDFFVNIEFYFNYYYNQIWEYLLQPFPYFPF